GCLVTLLVGFVAPIGFALYASSLAACYIAFVVAIFFTQLVGMAAALIVQTIGQRLYSRVSRTLLAVLAIAAAVAIGPKLHGSYSALAQLPQALAQSSIAQVLLAPFSVFGRLVTA